MISLLALSATIASGSHFTCALGESGAVYCFGANDSGQLGDGSRESRGRPVRVVGLSGAKEIATGENHACVVHSTGEVLCWGSNGPGSCGDPLDLYVPFPRKVAGLPHAARVFAGHSTSCAISSDGRLFCWGRNLSNQLSVPRGPNESGRPVPVEIKEVQNPQSVAIGESHTCALTKSGEVYCWGNSEHGRSGSQGGVVPPSRINIGKATAIAVTNNASFAVLADGTLSYWGTWQRDRDFVAAPVPTTTPDRNVTGIVTNRHTAFLRIGTNEWRFPKAGISPPIPSTDLSWAVELSAGDQYACGRSQSGELRCWGNNREGIGSGTPTNIKEPVVVPLDALDLEPADPPPAPPPAACIAAPAQPSVQMIKPTPSSCGNGKRDAIGVAGGECPPCMYGHSCPCSPRREVRETCDGTDLGGASCASLGYGGGKLSCTAQCMHDTSACVPISRLTSGAKLSWPQLSPDKLPTAGLALGPKTKELGAVWGAAGTCGQAVFGRFSPDLRLVSTSEPFGRPRASRVQLVATQLGWLAAVSDKVNTWVHAVDEGGQPGPERFALRGRPVFLQSAGPDGPFLLGLSTRNHPHLGGLDVVSIDANGEMKSRTTVFPHQASASETMDSFPPAADQVAISPVEGGFLIARAQMVPGVMDLGGVVVARVSNDGRVEAKSIITMGGTSPFFVTPQTLGWLSNVSQPGQTQRYAVNTIQVSPGSASVGAPVRVAELDPSEWLVTGAVSGQSPILLLPQVDAFQSTFQSNTSRRLDLLTLPKQRMTVVDGGGVGAAQLLIWDHSLLTGFIWQRDGRSRLGLLKAPVSH